MKRYNEFNQVVQIRRGNIITWFVMLVMLSVVLFYDPQLLTTLFPTIWNIPTIAFGSILFIFTALAVRIFFPEVFIILFNLFHYLFVILILSCAIRWNLDPESSVYEPMITLFAFFVAVMAYLRQQWDISESKHEIVELFKNDNRTLSEVSE